MDKKVFSDMALKSWNVEINRANKLFGSFSNEDLQKEIAPGRNRVIYLLGHLIAANDSMLSLFGLSDRMYAHFDEPFLRTADKAGQEMPPAEQLKQDWDKSVTALNEGFAKLTPDEWFAKHTSMTDEDLAKDPGRNKLSVLMNRTSHMAYHLGQIALAK
ncbi:DinB family protein [Taibaiella soli]|uniref:DinB family protein n=1 Tax=Taibaiella soli TaxID=1649169 RepID=A0A2W2AI74_9BACT|nr:DinB family protein [Taibaiella soli]PZF74971.1 DinB family protein [Taibaiella soli]